MASDDKGKRPAEEAEEGVDSRKKAMKAGNIWDCLVLPRVAELNNSLTLQEMKESKSGTRWNAKMSLRVRTRK